MILKIIIIFLSFTSISSRVISDDENTKPISEIKCATDDIINKFKQSFESIKQKIINDEQSMFDKITDHMKDYVTNRDYKLGQYIDGTEEILQNIRNLESKQFNVETNIDNIQADLKEKNSEAENNMKTSEEEFKNKLEKLEERKYLLTALMTQHCDDCDETLREYKLDVQLAQTDKDILELKEKFLKDSKENEENLKELNAQKTGELILNYSQLVDVLRKQNDEYKKMEEITKQKDNIIAEWKRYSENIEGFFLITRSDIQGLINGSINFDGIVMDIADKEIINTTPIESISSTSSPLFGWIAFDENTPNVPENMISTGLQEEDERSQIYVIRKNDGDTYLYGKYVFSEDRWKAFVTTDNSEYEVNNFEILTGENYSWCGLNLYNREDVKYPVCYARYHDLNIPGTLLEDGGCRVGYELDVTVISDNYYVLTNGNCTS